MFAEEIPEHLGMGTAKRGASPEEELLARSTGKTREASPTDIEPNATNTGGLSAIGIIGNAVQRTKTIDLPPHLRKFAMEMRKEAQEAKDK